ncbi:hypothetical protein AAZV13_04G119500 [Glycine max]
MRVRLASFFTGAAAASFLGLYTLHKDYKVPHQSFTQQEGGRNEAEAEAKSLCLYIEPL